MSLDIKVVVDTREQIGGLKMLLHLLITTLEQEQNILVAFIVAQMTEYGHQVFN